MIIIRVFFATFKTLFSLLNYFKRFGLCRRRQFMYTHLQLFLIRNGED
jgi:hypothetical protein